MADCSKTEVFLSEFERMCSCMYFKEDEVFCRECPAHEFISSDICDTEDLKRLYKVVQKWSDEHPIQKPKTYADVFFEMFPKAVRNVYGGYPAGACKRKVFDGTYCDAYSHCEICWNEPYEEDAKHDASHNKG